MCPPSLCADRVDDGSSLELLFPRYYLATQVARGERDSYDIGGGQTPQTLLSYLCMKRLLNDHAS